MKELNKRDPFDKHIIDLVKSGELKLGYAEVKKHKGDKECDVIIHKVEKK
jgi:hypothetical protein